MYTYECSAGDFVRATDGSIWRLVPVYRNEDQALINAICADGMTGHFASHVRVERVTSAEFEAAQPESATPAQVTYLHNLGATEQQIAGLNKTKASALIDELKRWKGAEACHYCGQPARGQGFFGEFVCAECGGR